MKPVVPLPIDSHLPAIQAAVRAHPRLLIQASPGTGKTTRVPAALLDCVPGNAAGQVWVLEPRRLAAKWAAHRVASERGENPGNSVGYQFRFEKSEGPATRLKFLTEGILLRKLARDPRIEEASIVVLDEFHERHLTTDLALACLLEVQKRRPDLKIVVMSATLDIQGLLPLLGPDTPVLEVEAPRHPVEIRHLKQPPERRLEDLVTLHARSLLSETRGDLLVFLPGMREIRRVESALQNVPARTLLLHGELSREEQDQVMQPGAARRIILSTNLAESSVTIPGISAVIDSGLHRIASHSAWSGVPALRTRPISKASAIQRAGRAGRTGPGICQRLFTLSDFEGRPSFEVAEIRRADLAQVILELRGLKILPAGGRIQDLGWLDFPELSQWEAGARLLWLLGFLQEPGLNSSLTSLGSEASGLSMHPRIARFLIEARRAGLLDEWLDFAVELAEGAPSEAARRQWKREIETRNLAARNAGAPPELSRALLTAFPDRVVRTQGQKVVAAAAGAVELSREIAESLALATSGQSVTAIALEVQERQSRELGSGGTGRTAPVIEKWIPIQDDWLLDLEPSLLREVEIPVFDERLKRVRWSSQLSYGELVLSEESREPRTAEEWKQAETILLKQAWRTEIPEGPISLARAQEFIAQLKNQGVGELADLLETLFARLLLIWEHQLMPGATLPGFKDLLSGAISGKLSLRELDEVDWERATAAALLELCPGLRLQDWTPVSILLPGPPQGARPGPRQARIHYRLGHAPWVESRLQDFWGLKATPTILAGRLPLTLHLLAPNQRAVQVTRDLPGFWARAYPEIRKELSRNYPRHFWP